MNEVQVTINLVFFFFKTYKEKKKELASFLSSTIQALYPFVYILGLSYSHVFPVLIFSLHPSDCFFSTWGSILSYFSFAFVARDLKLQSKFKSCLTCPEDNFYNENLSR